MYRTDLTHFNPTRNKIISNDKELEKNAKDKSENGFKTCSKFQLNNDSNIKTSQKNSNTVKNKNAEKR